MVVNKKQATHFCGNEVVSLSRLGKYEAPFRTGQQGQENKSSPSTWAVLGKRESHVL